MDGVRHAKTNTRLTNVIDLRLTLVAVPAKIPKQHQIPFVSSTAVFPVPFTASSTKAYLMRFPSLPTFIRTLYTFSNNTLRTPPSSFNSAVRPTTLRSSMPTIPFLGALFSTADSRKMSHPVQKSDSEWQAQLNPGEHNSCDRTTSVGPHCGGNPG